MLKSPLWQKKRLEILERDKFTCQSCFDTENELHVHHIYYLKDKKPHEYEEYFLLTLCKDCHKTITEDRKEIKFYVDIHFNDIDSIKELKLIMRKIGGLNPPELLIVNKYIDKLITKKKKHG